MVMFYTDLFGQKPRGELIQPWLGWHTARKTKALRVVNDLMSMAVQFMSQCHEATLIQMMYVK